MATPSHYFDHGWWDETAFAAALPELMDPVRVPYFKAVFADHEIGGRVLEIGCGGGVTSRRLAAPGLEVVGIDTSAAALAEANHHVPEAHFTGASGERLPFAAESFDAVVCSEVLEHVANPSKVIGEVTRVLRPGGLMLFSTPNRTLVSRLILIEIAQRWRLTSLLPKDLHHWQAFIRPTELSALMSDNGLAMIDVHGISIPVNEILKTIGALWSLKRRRLTHVEAARRVHLRLSSIKSVAYIGYAVKV